MAGYCYANKLSAFLTEEKENWINTMKGNYCKLSPLPLGESQIRAWKDCFNVLKNQFAEAKDIYNNFSIVFEYFLPYESGRRPDVLLISKEQIIVLEFKQKFNVIYADVDQAAAYARDIREYHFESRGCSVDSLLVLTGKNYDEIDLIEENNVHICSKNSLLSVIESILKPTITSINIDDWMNSKYEPLPTIVEAAKMFVKHEELPNIRRVNSTCIPQAIECLKDISEFAKANKEHVVAFVTGVPGAGKTFLGLQYVYDICTDYENVNSVYLSGNGPLVAVLTEALHSGVFVKDLHKVVNQYIDNGAPDFHNNIIVFDEGQRAWDVHQMSSKRNVDKSEPDIMVELCSKRLDWCVLLVLVGEGQEIHNGENSGLAQWNTAISKSNKDWRIICPENIIDLFPNNIILENENRNALNLSVSLRSHVAEDVSTFVKHILNGEIEKANFLSTKIEDQGFAMYITRNLEHGKKYLRNRYQNEPLKRYGMIASSKGKCLRNYGMDNSYQGSVGIYYIGKWFNADNDHPKSCCALNSVVTEFGCQGLEIDMPLIGWDNDMLWAGTNWKKYKENEPDDSDANTYRINSYRVLLTRGRDGFVIYVPDDPQMNDVYDILLKTGIKRLEH